MSREPDHAPMHTNHNLLIGGEMGARIADFDWSQTSLGPLDLWPQSLITVVRVLLNSRYPMFLWWGRDLINIYNDAYIPVLGSRHPAALGQSAPRIWAEIWDTIGPQSQVVMDEGLATWNESVLLIMERFGYTEETYFTFSYSPVPDGEGNVNGVFCACMEDTQRVIGERQLDLLRELAARTTDARTVEGACALSMAGLGTNPADLPFALLYLIEPNDLRVVLAGTTGIGRGHAAAPEAAALDDTAPWPFADAIATNQALLVSEIDVAFAGLPTGTWDRPPHQAVVVPIAPSGRTGKAGVMVVGLNPFRLFDDAYQRFIELAAGQIAAILANAQAYEEERQRAEALAELDRAKTTFFSNISHEFRTPLTLMLGPAEDALADPATDPASRERMALIHRNGLRLFKLVNTLLDFSRIEAGRVDAHYQATDLAALTAELASVFRSAIERAGIRLIVNCPPLPEPVYVNPEMWETIVFNLLANAFKFTFEGEIEVCVRLAADLVELTVRDTGTGIPAAELPHLFERFRRIEGARGRTVEGTGIGLALVQELARLHGGTVHVASELGRGSSFRVTVPRGYAHLPADRVGSAQPSSALALGRGAYVADMLRWLPDPAGEGQGSIATGLLEQTVSLTSVRRHPGDEQPQARIVVADDNADMRAYLRRLLGARYAVEAVADGATALAAAQAELPDLVVTDVMMPGLDGFALLRELRSDPRTRDVPVILLSARAGEEARVEGLEAGADDYLTKPFSVRELLARVDTRLELARLRRESTQALRESEARLRLALRGARMIAWEWDTAQNKVITTGSFTEIYGRQSVHSLEQGLEMIHPGDRERHLAVLRRAVEQGQPYHAEFRVTHEGSGQTVWLEEWGFPALNERGATYKLIGVTMDITERKLSEDALRRSEGGFRQLAASVPQLIWTATPTGDVDFLNEQWREYTGVDLFELHRWGWQRVVHPDDLPPALAAWVNALSSGEPLEFKHRIRHCSGEWRWQLVRALPLKDEAGQVTKWFGSCTDIHEQEQTGRDMQFLSDLAEQIRLIDDPGDLLAAVARLLGTYLQVPRCYFAEMDEPRDRWFIRRDYHAGLSSIEGEYRISDYPANVVQIMRAGQVLISNDTRDDPRSAPTYAQAYAPISVRAHVIVPLAREGRWVSNLVVATDTPRQWLPREIRLLETTAERIWLAVEKLRAEQALRESEERLQILYTQEQAARAQAEEASRLKDEFLATVSHELRTPLTAILGYGELIQSRKRDEAYIARALEKIMRSARSQAQLIEDLLDVSRIVTGKLRLDPLTMDLIPVIHAAIDAVRPALEAKLLRLEAHLDPEGSTIFGDPNRLQQVVWNLLSNAVKFTPQGGAIEIRLQRGAGYTQISVRDTGQGVSPEFLPYVFDRFRQADSASTRAHGGLGLGLAIVRHVVEMHGGTVKVESPGIDAGTTFTVCLPRLVVADDALALSDQPGGADAESWRCPPELDGMRVLVVDDQPDILDLIADMLVPCGAIVQVCSSTREALDLLREWQPEVLVSDIAMPGEDGYGLLRHVRALPPEAGGTIPAVALTAYVRLEDRTRVLAAGFQMYVPKPVDRVELLNVVASLARRPKL